MTDHTPDPVRVAEIAAAIDEEARTRRRLESGVNPSADSTWYKKVTAQNKHWQDGERKRKIMLQVLMDTGDLQTAVAATGSSMSAYKKWRVKFPEWAAKVDAIRIGAKNLIDDYQGGFAEFRKRYLGFDTPWFQMMAIDILESSDEGSVTLLLWPPEHGKTSLVEDWLCYKYAIDPSFRVSYVSEKVDHGEKVGYQVMSRMENLSGQHDQYVARFGPFAPQGGEGRKVQQRWAPTMFRVFKAGTHHRDPNFKAFGIRAQVAGTRADLLVADDLQSLRSENLTDKYYGLFRQDFLSRSGAFGRVVVVGTRVADDDIYSRMIEDDLVDHLLTFPAHKWSTPWPGPVKKNTEIPDNIEWLWPEHYNPENYRRMRINVGESGWFRNFMQQPRKAGDRIFDEETVCTNLDPLRAVWHDPPEDVHDIGMALDPGLGTNAYMVGGFTEKCLKLLDWRVDHNLKSNQQIIGIGEEFCHTYTGNGRSVVDFVIEDKAFQKGLMADEALQALVKQFGMVITGHQTGINKYDETLGVTALPRAFLRGEIEIPGADDTATAGKRQLLVDQFETWRPYKRGNRLVQDLVICTWFLWKRWQSWKAVGATTTEVSAFRTQGVPYHPTESGLLVPTRVSITM